MKPSPATSKNNYPTASFGDTGSVLTRPFLVPPAPRRGSSKNASYTFTISYEMNGGSFNESGRDLFVFARENGLWRAVWSTLLPSP